MIKIIGYTLIKEYPFSKPLGYFEPRGNGDLSLYPEFWRPVFSDVREGSIFKDCDGSKFAVTLIKGDSCIIEPVGNKRVMRLDALLNDYIKIA